VKYGEQLSMVRISLSELIKLYGTYWAVDDWVKLGDDEYKIVDRIGDEFGLQKYGNCYAPKILRVADYLDKFATLLPGMPSKIVKDPTRAYNADKCECGASSVYANPDYFHSDYCPKYKRP